MTAMTAIGTRLEVNVFFHSIFKGRTIGSPFYYYHLWLTSISYFIRRYIFTSFNGKAPEFLHIIFFFNSFKNWYNQLQ